MWFRWRGSLLSCLFGTFWRSGENMPQWLQEVLEPDGSRFKGRPCHSPAMGSLTNYFTFPARGRHTICVCLILCSLWAKNHFHILKMVGKKMKRGIILHDMCKLCEVQLSVSTVFCGHMAMPVCLQMLRLVFVSGCFWRQGCVGDSDCLAPWSWKSLLSGFLQQKFADSALRLSFLLSKEKLRHGVVVRTKRNDPGQMLGLWFRKIACSQSR